MTEVQELQERIRTTEGKKATRDFALGAKTEFETVVVKKSEVFTPEIAAGLGKIAEEVISKVETGFKAKQDEAKAAVAPAVAKLKGDFDAKVAEPGEQEQAGLQSLSAALEKQRDGP